MGSGKVRKSSIVLLDWDVLTNNRGMAVEATIPASSLVEGEECWLSNGVRGFIFGRVTLRSP
jgi:hypothetical protein